jgi:hypothetical protein
MGWIANLKAKRADKAATNEYNRLHTIWQEDVDTLKKLITVFTAASTYVEGSSGVCTPVGGGIRE